jgi:hypothetical protein
MFRTPAGEIVGRDYDGPKKKIADSRKEFRRLLELVALRDAGVISFLRTQVRFNLHGPNGSRLSAYVADFVYVVRGRRVVEDVKSRITKLDKMYRLKKSWLLDEHGIEIIET